MPTPAGNSTRARDIALLLIRLMIATIFLYHGSQKLFGAFGGGGIRGTAQAFSRMGIPHPLISAILSGCAEFFGGLIFLTGTGLRIMAIPLAVNMLAATIVTGRHGFSAMNNGCEYPLSLLVVIIAMALMGPGKWTLRFRHAEKVAS